MEHYLFRKTSRYTVPIPYFGKNDEKQSMLSYLREMLPESCSRGHNFHMDLESLASDMRLSSNVISIPLCEERINRNENIIMGIFGCKNPTLKDLKKLNSANILLLAAHLSGEMGLEIPVVKKELAFCQMNF